MGKFPLIHHVNQDTLGKAKGLLYESLLPSRKQAHLNKMTACRVQHAVNLLGESQKPLLAYPFYATPHFILG